MTERHKVFISFHHEDHMWKNSFVSDFRNVIVDKSVDTRDIIDTNMKTETIRQRIRDDYIRDATVTVVLIGLHTWKRKHVDWEINSSLRDTQRNPRCGLVGILLPSYIMRENKYNPYTVPPRLHDNVKCQYANVYNWSWDVHSVRTWIQLAFETRHQNPPPDLSRPLFGKNNPGSSWQ